MFCLGCLWWTCKNDLCADLDELFDDTPLALTCIFHDDVRVPSSSSLVGNISLTNMGRLGGRGLAELGKIPTFSRFFFVDVPNHHYNLSSYHALYCTGLKHLLEVGNIVQYLFGRCLDNQEKVVVYDDDDVDLHIIGPVCLSVCLSVTFLIIFLFNFLFSNFLSKQIFNFFSKYFFQFF